MALYLADGLHQHLPGIGGVALHGGSSRGGMSAAAQNGTHRTGIEFTGLGAQRNLAHAGAQLPDGDPGVDPLYSAHKGGNVVG